MSDLETFTKHYEAASPETQSLIDSEKIPMLSTRLCNEGVSQTSRKNTVLGISDFVLGIIDQPTLQETLGVNEKQLSDLLKELGFGEKQQTAGRVVPEANVSLKEKLELRPEGTPLPQPSVASTEESTKPLTREDVLSALSSRRTMAEDIQSVKKTNSSQEK